MPCARRLQPRGRVYLWTTILPRKGDSRKRAQRLIYTSSPDRGLDVLLEMWGEIRARVPEAVFSFAYADVYDAVAAQDPVIGAFRDKVAGLSDQPGVQRLGSLPQPEIARLMMTSQVWAHPSWSTPTNSPFHETSCIGAMEAQAAGCVIVASEWGALKETVKVGVLIGGKPLSGRWRRSFVDEIVRGLTDAETQAHAQQAGPAAVAEMGWDGVARQVAGLVDGEEFAFEMPLEGAPA